MWRLIRFIFGHPVKSESDLLWETNNDDLTHPVLRPQSALKADREVYTFDREFTLDQIRKVRMERVKK